MFRFISIFFLGLMITSACNDATIEPEESNEKCTTPATVRDLSGLDGCGFVFELEDGTRLIPLVILYCGTPPLPKDMPPDPLRNFEYVDGKKVFIDYTLTQEYAGTCMAGKYASINCISSEQRIQPDLKQLTPGDGH